MIKPNRTSKRVSFVFRYLTIIHMPRTLRNNIKLLMSSTLLYHRIVGAKLKISAETRPVKRSKISLDILYNTGAVRTDGTIETSETTGKLMPRVLMESAM